MMHSRLSKPKVSEVGKWLLMPEESNQTVQVHYADIDDAFLRVKPMVKGHRIKYFYGECAWMDARRYAGDIYSAVLYKS
jgi:hypothetical protein